MERHCVVAILTLLSLDSVSNYNHTGFDNMKSELHLIIIIKFK